MPDIALNDNQTIESKEQQDSSSQYMNPKSGSVSGNSAVAVTHAIPYGEEQGGLFDWFKRLFGFGKKDDAQQDDTAGEHTETEDTHTETDTGHSDTSDTSDINDPEETPDTASAWDAPAEESEYIARVPNKEEGAAVYNLEKNYKGEGVKTRPVFETHSFMPRKEIDEVEATYLHSFMGLRYTRLNQKTGRLERKRAKIGYGGHGFMDDTHTQADISTETAISMPTFEHVIRSIDQTARNIDAKKSGGSDSPGGFGGTYHLLTNNCNDFVEYMAREAGARVPETLHHSILGPAGAYKQLAQAAEQGNQGDTRFFQGGGKGMGQMSKENRVRFLLGYQTEAIRALKVDGIKPEDNAAFAGLINQLVVNAALLAQYIPESGSGITVNAEDLPGLATFLDDVCDSVRAVVQFHHSKAHPRLNISALKVEALASIVRNKYFPQKRSVEDLTQAELVNSLQNPTTAEKLANRQKSFKLGNDSLYRKNEEDGSSNLGTGDSQRAPASIILFAAGIDDIDKYIEAANKKDSARIAAMKMLNDVCEKLSANAERIRPYLQMYLDVRKGNSSRQCANLLASGVTQCLNIERISDVLTDSFALKDRETGEANEEDKKKIQDIEEGFVDKYGRKKSGKEITRAMQLVMNDFSTQLAFAKRIEAIFFEQIEAIRNPGDK